MDDDITYMDKLWKVISSKKILKVFTGNILSFPKGKIIRYKKIKLSKYDKIYSNNIKV